MSIVRRVAIVVGAALASVPAIASAQLPSATEVFLTYDHTCTVGPVRACASVQIQSLTTLEGTHVQIRFRNEQGSNWGIDNTGGYTLSNFSVWLDDPDLWGPRDESWIGYGTLGHVDILGEGVEIFDRALWVAGDPTRNLAYWGIHEYQTAIYGCDTPFAVDPTTGFDYNGGMRTCQGEGYDGWLEMEFFTPSQFTALDMNYSWGMLAANPEIGNWDRGSGVGCNPQDPLLCAHTVPEPATVVLLATGLLGLGLMARRRKDELSTDSPE